MRIGVGVSGKTLSTGESRYHPGLMLIDTHCHLTSEKYAGLAGGARGLVERARVAGVGAMITIGTSIADGQAARQLARDFPNQVFFAAGFHPGQAEPDQLDQLDQLAALLDDPHGPAPVALGEIGLDLHWRQDNLTLQRQLFAEQLQLAAARRLPIAIHARSAIDECIAILREHAWPGMHAVFHCYNGTVQQMHRIRQLGADVGGWCTVSFTGIVTYKKADDVREVATAVGLAGILVETDAPYLSPEPVRSIAICEPGFVVHTAAYLDRFFDQPAGTIATISTANAVRFFRLPIDTKGTSA